MSGPIAVLLPLMLDIAHPAQGPLGPSQMVGARSEPAVAVMCDRRVPDRPAIAVLDSFVPRVHGEYQRPGAGLVAEAWVDGLRGEMAREAERDLLGRCHWSSAIGVFPESVGDVALGGLGAVEEVLDEGGDVFDGDQEVELLWVVAAGGPVVVEGDHDVWEPAARA